MICQKKISNSAFLCIIFLLVASLQSLAQSNFSTKNGKVSFFSSTPLEDIKAVSEKAAAIFVSNNGNVAFQVPIRSFTFAKGLMQEHFNENYMESDKYPYAKFKGNIEEKIDYAKEGEYAVTAKGILNVHGVEKQRSIPGKLIVKDGKIRMISNFDVACVDHKIKIPTLVITKVAEVINVSLDATLTPLK